MDGAVPDKLKFSLSDLPFLFRRSFSILAGNDPLRMAGATAFFTVFALPFILILLTQFLGLIVNPDEIRTALFHDLSGIIGKESVQQVVETFVAFRHLAQNGWITAFGFLFLLLVATTLLMVIKGSINQLWRIRVTGGQGIGKRLRLRLQSVLIIVATGVLVLASIVAEAAKANMGRSLSVLLPTVALYANSVFNYVLSLIFVTLWFGILFRLLPDARPSWRVALSGAFVTAFFFTLGKYLLRILLVNSNIGSLYGASASVVIILLFVFYSSFILYFGAAFTRVWSDHLQQTIKPLPYAAHYKVTEVKEPLPSA